VHVANPQPEEGRSIVGALFLHDNMLLFLLRLILPFMPAQRQAWPRNFADKRSLQTFESRDRVIIAGKIYNRRFLFGVNFNGPRACTHQKQENF